MAVRDLVYTYCTDEGPAPGVIIIGATVELGLQVGPVVDLTGYPVKEVKPAKGILKMGLLKSQRSNT